ncbi:MAG: hydroxyacid dehydrogenase [Planctomycetaceae bacterium]|nr:hydroxyacid dehydrogenase [Planctomycetaceae bacterium]
MADFFHNSFRLPESLAYLTAAVIHCVLIILVVAVGALLFIWLERKVSGRIQDRLGPTRVGGAFGWLQTLADGIKLIAKEDITPKDADWLLFKLAPYIGFAASYCAYIALPFADGWAARHMNTAVFFILAVLGIEVFSPILAGYASGSKWSLFGAIREAAQVVSYEVPLGMCVVVPVFLCGTMNLVTIGNMQAGLFTNWLVFNDPFTFVIAVVYFTCATASVNRAPFDLAEAESELVAGFHTEYSGLRWSFFFMAEYGSMFLVSGLAAILFFGGWHGPIPIGEILGDFLAYVVTPLVGIVAWLLSFVFKNVHTADHVAVAGHIANSLGCLNFLLKGLIGVTVMMWVRWTLPRLRIDQVMTTCLKYCVPIAAICFLGALGWRVADWTTGADIPLVGIHYGKGGRGMVRESWVEQTQSAKVAENDVPDAPITDPNASDGPTGSVEQSPDELLTMKGGDQ